MIAAGALCGLIAANRQPDAILAVGLGLYGLRWAGRTAPLFVLSGLVPAALTLAYNLMIVGNVAGAYALAVRSGNFNDNPLGGLAGLLISPTRGLFVFSPFLLFVPLFIRRVLGEPNGRGLTIALGCAALVQIILYSLIDWRQGMSWGPRWLTDMLPILMWMLVPVLQTLSRNGRWLFGLTCAAAIAIEAIGAFWYTGVSDISILSAKGPDRMGPAWDIRNASFIAELSHPPVQPDLFVDLRGNIDAINLQAAGASAAGQVEVLGWALANDRSPRDVTIYVDGYPIGGTSEFFPRPDVVGTLGQDSPAGWRVSFPIGPFAAGEHLVAALVRANDGGEARFLKQGTFTLPAAGGAKG